MKITPEKSNEVVDNEADVSLKAIRPYAIKYGTEQHKAAMYAALDQLTSPSWYDETAWETKAQYYKQWVRIDAHNVLTEVQFVPDADNVYTICKINGNIVDVTFCVNVEEDQTIPEKIVYSVRLVNKADRDDKDKELLAYGVDKVGDWDDAILMPACSSSQFMTPVNGGRVFSLTTKNKDSDEWSFDCANGSPDFVNIAFVPITANKMTENDLGNENDDEETKQACLASSTPAVSDWLMNLAFPSDDESQQEAKVAKVDKDAKDEPRAIDPFRPIAAVRFRLKVDVKVNDPEFSWVK